MHQKLTGKLVLQSTVQGAVTKAVGSLLGLWLPLLPILYFMRKALGGGKTGAKYCPKPKTHATRCSVELLAVLLHATAAFGGHY